MQKDTCKQKPAAAVGSSVLLGPFKDTDTLLLDKGAHTHGKLDGLDYEYVIYVMRGTEAAKALRKTVAAYDSPTRYESVPSPEKS